MHSKKILPLEKRYFPLIIKLLMTIKVFLRIRPIESNSRCTIVESDSVVSIKAPNNGGDHQDEFDFRHYFFNKVFPCCSSQNDIYEEIAVPLLKKFQTGKNCALLCYGTYKGGNSFTTRGDSKNPGLVPRILASLILTSNNSYQTEIAILESNRNQVCDLLSKSKEKSIVYTAGTADNISFNLVRSTIDVINCLDTAISLIGDPNSKILDAQGTIIYVVKITGMKNSQAFSSLFHIIELGTTKKSKAKYKCDSAGTSSTNLSQFWQYFPAFSRQRNKAVETAASSSSSPAGIKRSIDEMKRADDEIVLVNTLLPILQRSAQGVGISIVASVNPHVKYYNETLTVLNNASFAMKATDLGDICRALCSSSPFENGPTSSKKMRINADIESSAIRETSLPEEDLIVASSTIPMPRERCISQHPAAPSASGSLINKRCSPFFINANNLTTVTLDSDPADEVTSLRREVKRLLAENQKLKDEAVERETAIRSEISDEMSRRTSHLMAEIYDLREELLAFHSQGSTIKKSVKKARKEMQRGQALEIASAALVEAEEELESVRTSFEGDISTLKTYQHKLETELQHYRENSKLDAPQDVNSNTTIDNTSAAEYESMYSQPIQRSSHIHSTMSEYHLKTAKGIEKTIVLSPLSTASKSPVRSPLSGIDANKKRTNDGGNKSLLQLRRL